jgi:probable F420-dependent oxidoreductase
MTNRPVGIWGRGNWLDHSRRSEACEVAAEIEALGYESLWLSAGFDDGVPSLFGDLLGATSTLTIASGVLSIWHSTATQTAAAYNSLDQVHPGRFLLGLGASHGPMVEATNQIYERPYSRMVHYLDELAEQQPGVPIENLILAALGPRMLQLAAERASGAHPYFVPVEYTVLARETMGQEALLIPEQGVVLESDPRIARAIARDHMELYLSLPNYTSNLNRLGFDDDEIKNGGSDRLVDAIIAWGGVDAIVERVDEQLAAGASSVCLQVLNGDSPEFPLSQYRNLATALF